MSRLSFALVLVVGLLAGGLGVALLQPRGLDDNAVRSVISDMLARDKVQQPAAVAELDQTKVNTLIEDFLMGDPSILQRMTEKLKATQAVAQRQAEKDAIAAEYDAIYNDAGNVVLGNPEGDVTLVEMFDYNCSYCRRAVPDLARLIAEDKNLKIILKEFPILTDGSMEAAKVAVLVGEDPKINYWDFHERLFAARGEVGADQALSVAEQLGASRVEMMLNMEGTKPAAIIQKSYDLAKVLKIGGTPTYILGDEIIPGAMGFDQLKEKIANMRSCGSTECPDAG